MAQVKTMLEYESWKTGIFFRMLRNFKKLTTPSWLDILLKYNDPCLDQVKDKVKYNDPRLDQVKDKDRKAYQVSANEQTYSFLKLMRNVITHLNEIRLTIRFEFNDLIITTTN